MEATQIMDVSDRETVEQDQHLSQKVLATLEILSPSASLGTKFDILFGVNKIGRDPEKCNIALENKV